MTVRPAPVQRAAQVLAAMIPAASLSTRMINRSTPAMGGSRFSASLEISD